METRDKRFPFHRLLRFFPHPGHQPHIADDIRRVCDLNSEKSIRTLDRPHAKWNDIKSAPLYTSFKRAVLIGLSFALDLSNYS